MKEEVIEVFGIQEPETVKEPIKPKEPEQKQVKPSEKKAPVLIDEKGMLAADSFEGNWRIAEVLVASRMLPQHYDTPAKVMAGIEHARELGLPPLIGLRQIAVINGNPSIWGELPLALVMKSGLMESFSEWFIDSEFKKINEENKNLNAEVFGAACSSKRVGFEIRTDYYTAEDAKKMGKWGKNIWAAHPKRMLQMRARSLTLKNLYPDVLSGISIAEYDHDKLPDVELPKDKYKSSTTEELDKMFSEGESNE